MQPLARRGGLVVAVLAAIAAPCAAPPLARGQAASVSAWQAADFRIWGFVPYWTPQSQINGFASEGVYDHVSDVLYFSGVRPTATGGLSYASAAAGHLAALKNHAAQHGFRFHMSMFDTAGGEVDAVWESIIANRTYRANFVNNVKNLLLANGMTGFNFDWERPDSAAEWGNYTQLARELRAAINPLGMEVSVDDFGSTDSRWDDSSQFDARTYDQLFIMGYHYGAASNNTFANGKLALTGQGAAKAFTNQQLVLGIGTWGDDGPATVALKSIAAANPSLAADALSFTGTANDLGGVPRTGTWKIESRYQVREKVQLALDRDMAGVMSWTLHYDAVNKLSLHRVAHHYAVFKRNVPDLNLDGRVSAADAQALANRMGTVPGWTGVATAAQFENFYWRGNWEQGDRDGDGFVNQQDADWLAARFAALGVALLDRLPFSGTFEKFQQSRGLSGRWRAARNSAGALLETGNFTQHDAGYLDFSATGAGAAKFSDAALTIRNQNAAEAYDSLNAEPRRLTASLAQPIDFGADHEVYLTMLIRQNTPPLLPAQLNSTNRNISLELCDDAGEVQLAFSFLGQQNELAVVSQADLGESAVSAPGFASDVIYLFVAKLSSHGGEGAVHASLFASGDAVGNFTDPGFPWMLALNTSGADQPSLSHVQFTSHCDGNFTVSNLWIGQPDEFFARPAPGDFDASGLVDALDLPRWKAGVGANGVATHWQGDGDGDGDVDGHDFLTWQRNLGATGPLAAAIPEPAGLLLGALAAAAAAQAQRMR
ncbi:MAG: hypothetical protein DCC67_06480 [Planctomycetota bacterium]|nr:MAG: hypothetical protein DCC67_06480 [Planctomycetota bacterium]